MKLFYIFLFSLTQAMCGGPTTTVDIIPEKSDPFDCDIAVRVVNDYIKSVNTRSDRDAWIQGNQNLTPEFKRIFKSLIDEAYMEDPEIGLGFDPILDAQDNPDEFILSSCDIKSGYVTLVGKDWPEFTLVLRVVKFKDNFLVDGSGVVNIPTDKRAKR